MDWADVRNAYPNTWVIIEALEAHTTPDQQRSLDRIAVIEYCSDGQTAFQRYQALHRQHPEREFYFFHTSRETLEIHEQPWIGIRPHHALHPQR